MKLSVLLSFLVLLGIAYALPSNSLSGENSTRTANKSWFHDLKRALTQMARNLWYMDDKCSDLDCPKYKIMKKTDDYELRCYQSYAWVASEYIGDELTKEIREKMFMHLFNYISGENVEKEKIKMTVPVATKVEEVGTKKRFTMLFFVPFIHQASPPRPTKPEVSIVRLPKICVYVRSFTFYTTKKRVERNIKKLESALKKDSLTDFIDPDNAYIYGGYDGPWTLPFLRHNEVWLLQK